MPPMPVKIMMNVGNPQLAFDFARRCPNRGVGLARLEFIINNNIGVHPRGDARVSEHRCRPEEGTIGKRGARLHPACVLRRQAHRRHRHDRRAFGPKPVIVRLSDFKSNEYAN
jgi:pyruvate,water dikinase